MTWIELGVLIGGATVGAFVLMRLADNLDRADQVRIARLIDANKATPRPGMATPDAEHFRARKDRS